jgi:thiamine biosynthesis protein ThiS
MSEPVQITVNGEARITNDGATVMDLLKDLGLDGGRVAVERNLYIVPRPHWRDTRIAAGVRFEIVQFVGGG